MNSAHPSLEGRVVKVWGQQGAIKGQERSRALIALAAKQKNLSPNFSEQKHTTLSFFFFLS